MSVIDILLIPICIVGILGLIIVVAAFSKGAKNGIYESEIIWWGLWSIAASIFFYNFLIIG